MGKSLADVRRRDKRNTDERVRRRTIKQMGQQQRQREADAWKTALKTYEGVRTGTTG